MTLDELDRLAAEKVMGWESTCYHWREGTKVKYYKTGHSYKDKKAWQPTRNIAQAWECLEKLKPDRIFIEGKDKKSCNISLGGIFSQTYGYECGIGFGSKDCDSATEAIVRACLKAKGVEV